MHQTRTSDNNDACNRCGLDSNHRQHDAVGAEIGLQALQALNSINVINGVPSLDVATIKAKIMEHGGDVIEEEWTAERCTVTVTRPGKSAKTATYTTEDAKLAERSVSTTPSR